MFSSQTFKYKSTTVAKYLLFRAFEDRIVINMTKLQKLLYIAYGTYLAITDERLTNESPRAWPYGPVFPTVRNKLLKIDFDDYDFLAERDSECKSILADDEMKSLMIMVLHRFGMMSAGQLIEWTHIADSAWDRTQRAPGFKWNDIIPDVYIKDYFKNIIVAKK